MSSSRPSSPTRSPMLKSAMKHPQSRSPLPSPKAESPNASTTSFALDADSGTSGSAVMRSESGSAVRKSESHTSASQHGFRRRVGFDTFEAGAETGAGTGIQYSFTCSAKTQDYCRTKQSRTFMLATDLNEYSVHALDWALNNLVEDHDEIVVLRVIEPGTAVYASWKADLDQQRTSAQRLLDEVMAKIGNERQVFISVEFAVGPIEEMIHRLVEVYKPDSLIVGTRGKTEGRWKSAFMGSISRYCVAKSPVPVVVVRPEDKVAESLSKRTHDPRKRSYVSLLHGTAELDENRLERITTMPAAGKSGNEGRKFLSPEDADLPSLSKKTNKKSLKMKRFGTAD